MQHCNKTTAIHQHGPINVQCLTTSIHVHVAREHSKPQTHFEGLRHTSAAAKHYAVKKCGGREPLILTPGTRWQWSTSIGNKEPLVPTGGAAECVVQAVWRPLKEILFSPAGNPNSIPPPGRPARYPNGCMYRDISAAKGYPQYINFYIQICGA